MLFTIISIVGSVTRGNLLRQNIPVRMTGEESMTDFCEFVVYVCNQVFDLYELEYAGKYEGNNVFATDKKTGSSFIITVPLISEEDTDEIY